jgi:hypothetical protein
MQVGGRGPEPYPRNIYQYFRIATEASEIVQLYYCKFHNIAECLMKARIVKQADSRC